MSKLIADQNVATSNPVYTIDSVRSKDGTKVGYRRYGTGPALMLVQGAVGTVETYHELASYLASDFTVYVPERRGRPLSPCEFTPDHSVERELDDLSALFAHSRAHFLFGLSSGAVIALEAARVLPWVHKLVLYEPPLYVPPRQMRFDLVARYYQEVTVGNMATAMTYALLAAESAPPVVKFIPQPLLQLAVGLFLRWDAQQTTHRYPPLRDMVPTIRFDFSVVSRMQNQLETFRTVPSSALLLSGTKSSAYLRQSPIVLSQLLPSAQRVEFQGLDHSGPWNKDRGGQPQVVAKAMQEFLRENPADL